jgi:adenylate cyclase
MSGDPEQEYFADGITEDIITALSHIPLLFVIARNSSFAYKGKAIDIRQIGRELGVRYVLEGSVRKAGQRLRITGQLVKGHAKGLRAHDPLRADAPRCEAPALALPRLDTLPMILVARARGALANEQRRLAAIVSIDVVGYSRLMGRNESGTHAVLKTHLAERVMPSLTRHGGRVVKSTGDGVLAEFGSTLEALSALIELQQGMANANREQPEADRIVFRAGVHLGEVIVEDNDIYGDAVNIAARLQGEALPGGILISRAVHEAARGRIKAEFHTFGELSLKNIVRPVRALRVAWEEADWPTETVAQRQSPGAAAMALPGPAHADNPSIAVLAFRNLSGDAEREYFTDGIVEDIITTLSRIPSFVVIARNSSYAYKGRSVDVRQIGRELGVRYIVDGSVRVAGNTLRISCELIDATDGKHLWAERYDGTMEDVFDLQDRITSSIVATIYPRVMSAEIARAQAKPTDNLSAYDLYLRAVAAVAPNPSESSTSEALVLLDRAIDADPKFSSAYGYVACAHWLRLQNAWGSIAEAKQRGYEAAKRAVEIGSNDPVAQTLGGFGIGYLGGQLKQGLAYIERALTLNPNLVFAWQLRGVASGMIGKHENSIQCFKRAMQLSPRDRLAHQSYMGISHSYFFLGHYDQALYWVERALLERSHYVPALILKLVALVKEDIEPDKIRDAVQEVRSSTHPLVSVSMIMRRTPLARSADRELFESALRKAGLPE